MEFRDLVYWLQGFFELSEAECLSETQTSLVHSHVKMAIEYGKNSSLASRSRDFAMWLNGLLLNKASIDQAETASIRSSLNSIFEHEIDPSMPDKDKKLQLIHDNIKNQLEFSKKIQAEKDKLKTGGLVKSPGDDVVYRC